MSITYTILKSSLIHSTIWDESPEICKVWVTMLAMRNKDGEILSSVPGLAHASRISLETTKAALFKFLAPDPDSTTKEHEGRRLEAISGGWRLLNHDKVQAEVSAAHKAAYMKSYMQDRRAKGKETLREKTRRLMKEDPITKADAKAMKEKVSPKSVSGTSPEPTPEPQAAPTMAAEYDLGDTAP